MAWKYRILWRNVQPVQRTARDDILALRKLYSRTHDDGIVHVEAALKKILLENSPRTKILFSITIKNTSSYHFSDEQFQEENYPARLTFSDAVSKEKTRLGV
jgi:hypothetical protein